jgi:hypothetical protein
MVQVRAHPAPVTIVWWDRIRRACAETSWRPLVVRCFGSAPTRRFCVIYSEYDWAYLFAWVVGYRIAIVLAAERVRAVPAAEADAQEAVRVKLVDLERISLLHYQGGLRSALVREPTLVVDAFEIGTEFLLNDVAAKALATRPWV